MENKKTKIISMIAIIALVLTVITATYAYFQAQTGTGASTDVKINANTVDTLTFEAGSAISLNLNQDNFASGAGNQTGSTFAKANLSANNKTNSVTKHYYLYLNISSNTFTYSIDNNTPEILLQVKDSSGTDLTSITGLSYKTVTDGKGTSISGFDITTKSGLITLLDNREITTTSTKTDTWNITITYINYNADQSANAGKSFDSKVMIQEDILSYHEICNDNTLACYTAKKFTGTQGDNDIYYHNASLTNGAGDNSYRYAGANPNNFVCFGSDASTCPDDNLYRIIGVIDGKVKLIKYDYANSNLLGTDGDYYDSETPDASYYKGKLTSVNTYYWNYKNDTTINDGYGSNTWSTSLLNKTNLNTNFINNIGATWANKIETTTWKVGGNTFENISEAIPSVAYQNEITNPVTTNTTDNATTYDAKIGLMYVSDYGFAASPSAWTSILYDYDSSSITSVNWMHMGVLEWTISRISDYSRYVFRVIMVGNLNSSFARNANGVRPSFNLTSSTSYVSGSGSMSDPIRIN